MAYEISGVTFSQDDSRVDRGLLGGKICSKVRVYEAITTKKMIHRRHFAFLGIIHVGL